MKEAQDQVEEELDQHELYRTLRKKKIILKRKRAVNRKNKEKLPLKEI